MNATRAFNVMTLTTILLLAGCFGADDSSASADETDDGTITVTAQDLADAMLLASNSPPELTVKEFYLDNEAHEEVDLIPNNWKDSGYFVCLDEEDIEEEPLPDTLDEQRLVIEESLEDGEYIHLANLIEPGDCMGYFDFLSVDPDGDSMTKGIDTNFDGTIDIPIEPNHGLTMVAIDDSINKQVWNRGMSNNCEQIDLAFIAVDEHGASTVEFFHLFGMDSCDDEDDYDDSGGSLDFYSFMSNDAAGTMDDGGNNALVEIMMTQGTDLNWALLKVVISVDGGTPTACGDADSDMGCTWTPFEGDGNDQAWEVSEGITISEGSGDLCDGFNGGCEVQVTITKTGTGSDPDTVLAMVNAFASA
jgi:hypothetical protein